MTLKTILMDPSKNEVIASAKQMMVDYNASESNSNYHITLQDQNDLNEMFGIEEYILQ